MSTAIVVLGALITAARVQCLQLGASHLNPLAWKQVWCWAGRAGPRGSWAKTGHQSLEGGAGFPRQTGEALEAKAWVLTGPTAGHGGHSGRAGTEGPLRGCKVGSGLPDCPGRHQGLREGHMEVSPEPEGGGRPRLAFGSPTQPRSAPSTPPLRQQAHLSASLRPAGSDLGWGRWGGPRPSPQSAAHTHDTHTTQGGTPTGAVWWSLGAPASQVNAWRAGLGRWTGGGGVEGPGRPQ